MEYEKIIFWRNFLLRTFVIGVVFAVLFFIALLAFWDTWETWLATLFHTEEIDLAEVSLTFFMNVRIVLVFLVLAPALALHLMAKKAK